MTVKNLQYLKAAVAVFVVALLVTPAGRVEAQEPESASVGSIPSPKAIAALPADGGPEFNRLVFEKSPYLLQHAPNPVDWYPWGTEAFERARREDKPILLSIGYSTCHWCHVMERESFSDTEVAALLNEAFICIKVDREERPDVDQLYMAASIASRGSGGWPQTVLMAWDKRPFFLASYLPKESRPDRLGLIELIGQSKEYWSANRAGLDKLAGEIMTTLKDSVEHPPGKALQLETLTKAYEQLAGRFDPEYGGFDRAAKFPATHHLSFLLRYWKRTGEANALAMVEKTTESMAGGGLYDHIGGGFHRYTVDRAWTTPHFEKMLYDQAMLAMTYTEAYQATGKMMYSEIVRETLDYVLRDLTAPEGGFYTASDADTLDEEGRTYTWTIDEVRVVLGAEDGEIFIRAYGFEADGNYADQATGEKVGLNIPRPVSDLQALAAELELDKEALKERLATMRERLRIARQERPQPTLDDKILTDWNGLMIAALARAAQVLEEPRYAVAAERAAEFLFANVATPDGALLHRFREGDSKVAGQLDDYAFLTWGLLELYEATFEVSHLTKAVALNEQALKLFWDSERGGLFMSADAGPDLPMRIKEPHDRARPAGNSVAALNFLRIARMTANTELENKALKLFASTEQKVSPIPAAFTQLLVALDFSLGPSHEVVIAGARDSEDTRHMLRALRTSFTPNKVVLFRPLGDNPPIAELAEFTRAQKALDGHASAYVCKDYVCLAPTTSPKEMLISLSESR